MVIEGVLAGCGDRLTSLLQAADAGPMPQRGGGPECRARPPQPVRLRRRSRLSVGQSKTPLASMAKGGTSRTALAQ